MTNDLRAAVKAFLERTGRTQTAWAAELGITKQRLSQILDGESVPSLPLALRMSEQSGVRIELFASAGPDERMANSKPVEAA